MKKLLWVLWVACILLSFTGCKTETSSNELPYTAYLASSDNSGLVQVYLDLEERSTEEQVFALLSILKTGYDGAKQTIPKNIEATSVVINEKNAVLTFNEAYLELQPIEEIILRSSVVRTLTALEDIDTVEFYIGSVPYTDVNGKVIGAMKSEDVILAFDELSKQPVTKVVTLYFASKEDTVLVPVDVEMTVNSNEQFEQSVLNLLIKGPDDENLFGTIPEGTQVKSVYTNEGVCYVDFNEAFATNHLGGSTGEMLTIYSIVNTLTNLPNINKVQFLIEGEIREEYKGHYQFNIPFQKDLDLVQKQKDDTGE